MSEAQKLAEDAAKYARETKHVLSLAVAGALAGILHRLRRDSGSVLLHAEETSTTMSSIS